MIQLKYLEWNLLLMLGNEVWYQYLASLGDPDYSKFWNRAMNDPENTRINSISEGIAKMGNEFAILHVSETMLKRHFLDNPPLHKVKVFGRSRPVFMAFIVTKNSPLKPILNHGFKQVHLIIIILL